MICTVTFNPSLDYIVRVDDMRLGVINRTSYEQILPGGKGINVSIVLGNLGHPSRALGFSAGFTGIALESLLDAFGVDHDLVRVKEGFTRINAKIKSAEETELNKASTIDGQRLSSEDAIAEYIASMLLLETDPVFYISYDGVYTTGGTDYYEFRCHR